MIGRDRTPRKPPVFLGDRVGVWCPGGTDVEPLFEAYGDEPVDLILIAVPEGKGAITAADLTHYLGLDKQEATA